MTRNLALGVEFHRLFEASSLDDVRRIAGEMLADIRDTPFPPRAGAIADEVAATEPDVVCLQEAAKVRTQRPSDFRSNPTPNATSLEVDFLSVLASKLEDRGLAYEVAASTVTTDVEVPADVDGDTIDVRLTDRDAVLVHADHGVGPVDAGTYDAVYSPDTALPRAAIERGYVVVDVTVGDAVVTVADTHLEAADRTTRRKQAEQLLARLPTDRPVVLAGDLNSGPGGSREVYDLLRESFTDAHAAAGSGSAPTCCQDADLRNESSSLSSRVDVVMARGGATPASVRRVGHEPADRVEATVDGQPVRLWPSDHAGVVAGVEVPATATATRTASTTTGGGATPESASTDAAEETVAITPTVDVDDVVSTPGFGPGVAAVALLAAGAALRRRVE